MSLRVHVAPLFCAVGLLVGSSACSSDDSVTGGDPTADQNQKPGKGDGGHTDAGDAGKKDGSTRDATTPPPVTTQDGGTVMGCGSVTAAAQLETGPADVVIVLDTSGSMADEICNVSMNLTAFAEGVGDNAHVVTLYDMGVLGLITATLCGSPDPLAATPLAMDPNRYLHLPVNVDSWKALTDLVDNFDQYKSFLRPDAPTNFVVVSDDESKTNMGGLSAADFTAKMTAKLGHNFIFHAIVADGQNGCFGSNTGTTYLTLADQTGGQKLPICSTDWTAVFGQLEEAVVKSAPIPCEFEIPPSPSGDIDFDAVQVKFTGTGASEVEFPRATDMSKCGDNPAWYYDDASHPSHVELCPSACDAVKQGGDINLAFGCAPTLVL